MIIADRLKSADIPHETLEDFIAEYMLVMNVEADLTAGGQEGLLIAFLKLQQDCGVQIDLTKTLKGENVSLNGAAEPELRYGIDEGAVAPGEHTERTYAAYEAVTRHRLETINMHIAHALSDRALAQEYAETLTRIGLSFPSYPESLRALPAAAPPPPGFK